MSSPARGRGRSARFQAKRDHVVDVAVELFSRNGYAGTGVADIGEAAGFARGALYYYIGSKEELLVVIHDKVMDPLLAEISALVELDIGFRARLRLLSESLLRQILGRPDHVRVFLHEHRQLQGDHREQFRRKRARFESQIRRVLEGGLADGQLGVNDLELATLAFLNLHNYTYQWAHRRDLRVEELARFYCEVFLDGIGQSQPKTDPEQEEVEFGRSVLALLQERGLQH